MPKRKGATQDVNRAAMAEACVALVAERGWSHATVAAIAERADVNRSTFHRNFASREDAIRLWYRQMVEAQLETLPPDEPDMRAYLAHLFEAFEEHRAELLALHAHRLSYLLLDALDELFCGQSGAEPDVTRRLALYYHTGGIFNAFVLWFDTGMTMGAGEFAAVCAAAMPAQARPVLPRLRR